MKIFFRWSIFWGCFLAGYVSGYASSLTRKHLQNNIPSTGGDIILSYPSRKKMRRVALITDSSSAKKVIGDIEEFKRHVMKEKNIDTSIDLHVALKQVQEQSLKIGGKLGQNLQALFQSARISLEGKIEIQIGDDPEHVLNMLNAMLAGVLKQATQTRFFARKNILSWQEEVDDAIIIRNEANAEMTKLVAEKIALEAGIRDASSNLSALELQLATVPREHFEEMKMMQKRLIELKSDYEGFMSSFASVDCLAMSQASFFIQRCVDDELNGLNEKGGRVGGHSSLVSLRKHSIYEVVRGVVMYPKRKFLRHRGPMGPQNRTKSLSWVNKVLKRKIHDPDSENYDDVDGSEVRALSSEARSDAISAMPEDAPVKHSCQLDGKPDCDHFMAEMFVLQGGKYELIHTQEKNIIEKEANFERSMEATKHSLTAFREKVSDSQARLEIVDSKMKEAKISVDDAQLEYNNALELFRAEKRQFEGRMHELDSSACSIRAIRHEMIALMNFKLPEGRVLADCIPTEWRDGICPVTCGGSKMTISREVVSEGFYGVKCEDITMNYSVECNRKPCPIDCVLDNWSSWSSCSQDCDSGDRKRTRNIKVAPVNKGAACEIMEETQVCNTIPCDADCKVSEWQEWAPCSQDCNGGYRHRNKLVVEKAIGTGSCPPKHYVEMDESEACNEQLCTDDFSERKCHNTIDLLLMLDVSGDQTESRLEGMKRISEALIARFNTDNARVGLIAFGGPRNVPQKLSCDSGKDVESCGVKLVSHYDADIDGVEGKIASIKWQKGGTNLGQALAMAESVLIEGRADAFKTVLVITDSRPMDPVAAETTAKRVREAGARLMIIGIGDILSRNPGAKNLLENMVSVFPAKEANLYMIDNFEGLLSEDTEVKVAYHASELLMRICDRTKHDDIEKEADRESDENI